MTAMTVGQLKAALSEFRDDMRVLVQGYEGGYDDPARLVLVWTAPREYESVCGRYIDDHICQTAEQWLADRAEWGDPPVETFDAVVISRW